MAVMQAAAAEAQSPPPDNSFPPAAGEAPSDVAVGSKLVIEGMPAL